MEIAEPLPSGAEGNAAGGARAGPEPPSAVGHSTPAATTWAEQF